MVHDLLHVLSAGIETKRNQNDVEMIFFSSTNLISTFLNEMGKCLYSRDWPKRYPWVKETDNKHKAHCCACNNKDIDVAQMGESALCSHASGDTKT